MTTTSDLAKALRLECNRQALTLTDVIKKSSVSRAAVYRLFNGEDVQLTTLLAVTNLLGLDVIAVRSAVAKLVPEITTHGGLQPTPGRPNTPTGPVIGRDGSSGRFIDLSDRQQAPRSDGPPSAVSVRAAQLRHRLNALKK